MTRASMREGFRRLRYLIGAVAFGLWLYWFFSQPPAANTDDIRFIGDLLGISETKTVPFFLTYLIAIGLIFFFVAAALTRFIGWVVSGFVSTS
jgi:hypothetical protein